MLQAYSNYNSYAKTFNGNFKYSIDINDGLYSTRCDRKKHTT